MTEVIFSIGGMSCAACSSGIERALGRREGVALIEVNLIQESAKVKFDEAKISLEAIFGLLEKMGYEPSISAGQKRVGVFQAFEERILTPKVRVVLASLLSGIIVYIAMFGMHFENLLPSFLHDMRLNASIQLIVTLAVMHLGRDFYFKGFGALLHASPNMNTLVALGSGVSFLYSLFVYVKLMVWEEEGALYFEGVCVILTFILLGKFLENYAKNKAMSYLNENLEACKSTALRQVGVRSEGDGRADTTEWGNVSGDNAKQEARDGGVCYEEVPIQKLEKGDRIKIPLGESVPVDGALLCASASLQEAMLSGESLPVAKSQGDTIWGGSVNVGQAFVMEVVEIQSASKIAQILKLVREAQNDKAPIARIADIVSGYFVPFVMVIALLAGGFWWLYTRDFGFGLSVVASVLLVSCPCALGLATPMAILLGSIKASQNGLIFKNASALEASSKVDCVVFDKTGTLTCGKLGLSGIEMLEGGLRLGLDENALLALAGSLEVGSAHPIAKAITQATQERALALCEGSEFCEVAGEGISAKINGEVYRIARYDMAQNLTPMRADALMAVCVSRLHAEGEEALGVIYLEDTLREDSRRCVEYFIAQGKEVMILSGDCEVAVRQVACKLGIEQYHFGLKPQDKLAIIQSLKNADKRVMMVGDGLNDAPSLARADVSVAMGMGSDLSKDRADIIVLNDRIFGVANAVNLAKAVLGNIKGNLFWAFFYNIIAIGVACGLASGFGVMLDPMIAAFAMSFSSLFVVLNAQRLRFFKFVKERNGSEI